MLMFERVHTACQSTPDVILLLLWIYRLVEGFDNSKSTDFHRNSGINSYIGHPTVFDHA